MSFSRNDESRKCLLSASGNDSGNGISGNQVQDDTVTRTNALVQ